jgi:hypothetical protein
MKKYAASDGRLLLAAAMIEVNEGGHRVTDNAHVLRDGRTCGGAGGDGDVNKWAGFGLGTF